MLSPGAFAALGAQVAIVLQVHAVEFDELLVVLDDRAGHGVLEAFGQGAAQILAGFLDVFVASQFFGHVENPAVVAALKRRGRR